MGNALQEQLLKTGLVTKKQIHKAKQEKSRKNKQQKSKKEKVVDADTLKIQRAAEDKAKRDRELNKKERTASTPKSDFYRNQSTYRK